MTGGWTAIIKNGEIFIVPSDSRDDEIAVLRAEVARLTELLERAHSANDLGQQNAIHAARRNIALEAENRRITGERDEAIAQMKAGNPSSSTDDLMVELKAVKALLEKLVAKWL